MDMLNVTIDGVKVSVPAGTTVLEAARKANIHIPTLCYLKDINQIGACRMCVVDVGARALAAACVMPVSEGMVVKTNTPAVRAARKSVLELILSNHKRVRPAGATARPHRRHGAGSAAAAAPGRCG